MSEYTGPIHDDRPMKMVCRHCGSEDVLRDAYANWNVDTQQWELMNLYDDAICTSEKCDGNETKIEEVLVDEKYIPESDDND